MSLALAKRVLGWSPEMILHVGAHAFEEADEYVALGAETVLWFEPVPHRPTPPLPPGHHLYEVAVGLAPREREFFIYDASEYSGFCRMPWRLPLLRINPKIAAVAQVEVCPLTQFQDAFEKLPSESRVALVVDTQGSELEVLLSADLQGIDYVVVETSRRGMYAGVGNTRVATQRVLEAHGFGLALDLSDPILGHGNQYYSRPATSRDGRIRSLELRHKTTSILSIPRSTLRRIHSAVWRRAQKSDMPHA